MSVTQEHENAQMNDWIEGFKVGFLFASLLAIVGVAVAVWINR